MVALAGPPASGKSTSAERLADELNVLPNLRAQIVPMDGFHYDDAVLAQLGLSSRKGAPNTFDVAGFMDILERLKTSYKKAEVAVPLFDRDRELSRNAARLIDRESNVVIVEGNYLLLNQAPWGEVAELFDLTAMIECKESILQARLTQRWADQGYDQSRAQAWIETNDLPNIRTVHENSGLADFILGAN